MILAVLLTLGSVAFAADSTTESTTDSNRVLDELQERYDKLEKEIKENEEKLGQVNDEKKEQKKVVEEIYSQIDALTAQINTLSSRIDVLNADISATNSQISAISKQIRSLEKQIEETETAVAEKQTELQKAYDLLKARIRAMYMAGNGSTLECLLTAQDFSTLLTYAELLLRVAQHDNDLMTVIENDISELETLETSLNESRDQAQSQKAALDGKVASLNSTKREVQSAAAQLTAKQNQIKAQYAQAQQEMNSLNKESAEYVALIRKQEKELDSASRQIEAELKRNGSKTSDTPTTGSTQMIFPLKCKGVYISSPYGYRVHPITGVYKLHTGTDFCAPGIYRQPIYAVRDGVVYTAQASTAYGNYIVIDHGGGIATLYAHCDSLSVVKNAKVKQGQVIGLVGQTGYATGPHLHFEVRVNGTTVDPMQGYLTLPK